MESIRIRLLKDVKTQGQGILEAGTVVTTGFMKKTGKAKLLSYYALPLDDEAWEPYFDEAEIAKLFKEG